ncbi:hypothetical protein F2Q68_00020195 [Brassica cretica]|uniref:Uncharacterized protein n=1 Tax=Brassica cretica TaxID=69181 RepID=A0A8S9FVL7_BRACR|nr:hypothetical protein F2Q68_00020195 [Brassica cretica]
MASSRVITSASPLPTRVCDPASPNPREIVDASFLPVRAGSGVHVIQAALELFVGSSRCLDAVLELGHCKDCERYQYKSFELNIVVSHACLAVVSLLCVSHNLRKHGIRKFLFVDQLSGRMGRLKAQYIQELCETACTLNSVRLLALWSLPCFGLKAVREIIRMLYDVQLDPEFFKNVGQIVLFGGAFAVNGNVNPASEANVKAADIVFTCGADVIAVGINVTHQVIMTGQSRFQFNKSMVVSQPIREEEEATQTASTLHHQMIPSELTQDEFAELTDSITEFHTYQLGPGRCSSLLAQRIKSPPETVWSVVRRFDRPQTYKHFIKSCSVDEGFEMRVGCTRYVDVISGLPANTSRERLDLLDDDRRVTGFSITGGEHRLRNYKSVTTVHGFERDGRISSVVLESYVVDVPEGNTEEDTRLFADTVVKLNLQKLASVAEGMDPNSGDGRNSPVM